MWKIIVFVLAFSFLVLMLMLRSIVLPLKAVLMNLLSIGAAYGVLIAVFQWGWLDGLAGFQSLGALDTLTPPLVLAVVFGLSMDYEVFLLSRIKERYDEHGDNRRAVAEGLASSASVITSAALIMVCVFSVFVLTGVPSIKQLGLGNAVAIAIDATLVRLILVPAAMQLLGRWNWWLPGWLDRLLPHVGLEGAAPKRGRHQRDQSSPRAPRLPRVIWQEPAKGGYPDRSFLGLPGIDRMGAGRKGLIPYSPMGYLTELEMTEGSLGHSTFAMPASPWFANSSGLISAGMLAVIGDAALGSVVHSLVEAGQGMTTAELSMSFLRPVVPRGGAAVTGSGQLIHRGRTMGISEAFLFDSEDQLISHGTTRCSVFPPVDPIPEPPDLDATPYDDAVPGSSPDDPLRQPVQGEVLAQEEFDDRDGLEILRALVGRASSRARRSTTSPGSDSSRPRRGSTVTALPCSKWLSTSAGTIQGGFTAMLAESAMTSAAFSTAAADTAVAPLDFKVNYLRPVFPDGNDLIARARILHRGRTLVIAAAEITNSEGKQVALATGSSMYLPGRPANLVGVELGSASSDPEDDPGA